MTITTKYDIGQELWNILEVQSTKEWVLYYHTYIITGVQVIIDYSHYECYYKIEENNAWAIKMMSEETVDQTFFTTPEAALEECNRINADGIE